MMTIETIAGKNYSARECTRCNGTGRKFDITSQDVIAPSPFAGRCSCHSGKVLTLMPEIEIAHAMAIEKHARIIAREQQAIGEMPDWMF